MFKQRTHIAKISLILFASVASAHADDTFNMDVSPHVCIVEENQTRCEMTVNVAIAAQASQHYCVRLQNTAKLQHCHTGSHTFTMQVELTESTQLQAVNEHNGVLGQHVLTVGQLIENQYRRKRRYGWGL